MKLHRNASNQLTASRDVDASRYRALVSLLIGKFDLTAVRDATVGLDVAFQEFSSGNLRVSLEWDNWMGFQIVALSPESEALVERMAALLDRSEAG